MKTLVISDQALTVFALSEVLKQCDPTIQVVGAAHLGEAAARLEQEADFELIVLDIDIPGIHRTLGVNWVRQKWPDIPLTVLSAVEPDDDVVRSVDAGAMGYFVKTTDTELLVHAFKQVLAGGFYLPEISPPSVSWEDLRQANA